MTCRSVEALSIIFALLFGCVFQFCSGAQAKPTAFAFYNLSAAELRAPPGSLIRFAPLKLPSVYRAKAWRILYVTRDYASRPIASSGLVLASDYDRGGKRIVAWAHPTTGIARKCAPSLRQTPLAAIEGSKQMIADGFIVAATDYPGLGTEGPMGYLVGLGQARAVIDSVRAARQLLAIKDDNRFGLWGYSQGAHAVLFAADIADAYAPELSLIGAAAAAAPTDLSVLFKSDIGSLEGRVLASMTLVSWSRKFAIPIGTLVDDVAGRAVTSVTSNCVDDVGSQLDVLSAQKPLEQDFLSADPTRLQPWSKLLKQNSVRKVRYAAPLFIAQGTADTLVPQQLTLGFIRDICRLGSVVKYYPVDNTGHSLTGTRSANAAISWLSARFDGARVASSCR